MQIAQLLSISKPTYLVTVGHDLTTMFLSVACCFAVQLENMLSFGSSLAKSAYVIQSDHFSISQE